MVVILRVAEFEKSKRRTSSSLQIRYQIQVSDTVSDMNAYCTPKNGGRRCLTGYSSIPMIHNDITVVHHECVYD